MVEGLRMTQQQMNIREALLEARTSIDPVDARILLGHTLNAPKEHLATHPDRLLTNDEAARFRALVDRRANGEPVAYLTGRREFYGRDFDVTPAVLIPRPETELLVDVALQRMPADHSCRVLDLGTGNGAIAITLACERPQAMVTAVDAAQAALDLASRNARRLIGEHWASRLTLLHGDWYRPVAGQRFHLIVANPPYVAEDDPHLDQGDLRFEPRAALTPGGDGLAALHEIIRGAGQHLRPGGWLLCEHGYDQGHPVRTLFQAAGLVNVYVKEDLARLPRVASGQFTQATGN